MVTFTFPKDFLFGTGGSSFQIEGSPYADGKGENVWDHDCKVHPEMFYGQATPEQGSFFYTHYEEDIRAMKELGQNTYRLSLSWTRILPNGTGKINQKGIDFYNRVIDLLIENGIEPFVDIYHWDLPQTLAEIGGFKNKKVIDYYVEFARICFENFGDRVKLWSTMNEPSVFCFGCYTQGVYPPYETSLRNGLEAAHNILIAHYRIVKLYKSMGLAGKIGAVIAIVPIVPSEMTQEDIGASRRQMDILCDWWLRPMFEGKYPEDLLRDCPDFAREMPADYARELAQEFVPMDMVGLNYYYPERGVYEENTPTKSTTIMNYYAQEKETFQYYPAGLYDAMLYVKETYGNPEIYITENGLGFEDSGDYEQDINDDRRVEYLREHLRMVVRSIRAGVNIKGYYYWSNTDSFEMTSGYRYRFGLTYVNWRTGERTFKKSWRYYKQIIANKMVN